MFDQEIDISTLLLSTVLPDSEVHSPFLFIKHWQPPATGISHSVYVRGAYSSGVNASVVSKNRKAL